MSEQLRFVMVGPGGMGRAHVEALAERKDARLVGVCDVSETVRAEYVAQGLPAYENWEDLYREVEADCALLSLPHYLYPEAVIGALERGLHVLKEKPFARCLADAERMAQAAERTGKTLMVAGQTKFGVAFQHAQEVVSSGALGDIFLARATIIYYWDAAVKGQWSWRGEHRLSGGTAIVDSGYHPLDLLQTFRGTPAAVYAATGTMKAAPESEYDVDDKAVVTLEYPDGGVGVVTICFLTHPAENRMTLHGTRASLDVTHEGMRLLPREGEPTALDTTDARNPIALQLEEFISAVREGRPPLGDHRHALQVQRVIEAAYQSAAEGRRVEVG